MTNEKSHSSPKYVRFKQYRCRRIAKMFYGIDRVLVSDLPLRDKPMAIALILRPSIAAEYSYPNMTT